MKKKKKEKKKKKKKKKKNKKKKKKKKNNKENKLTIRSYFGSSHFVSSLAPAACFGFGQQPAAFRTASRATERLDSYGQTRAGRRSACG